MRAFTILELLIILVIISVLATVAVPALSNVQMNLQIEGAAANTVSLLERARSEAGKRGVPVVLAPSFGGEDESEILLFADYHHALNATAGSDLIYSAGTDDESIVRWRLDSAGRAAIRFWSPLDETPEGANAIRGFTTNPTDADLPPVIVFNGNTIESLGALSFGLSAPGSDQLRLCREVDVSLLSGQAVVGDCEGASS